MTVRPLSGNDLAEWLRLRRLLWPDCSEAMHAHEMAEQTAAPDERGVFVLARDDGLGGFAEVSVRDRVDGSFERRVAYLEGWFVEPDLRGQGFGRQLLDAVEAWATARGLRELASDAELEDQAAQAAHRALGFRETFRLVHFLKRLTNSRSK